MKLNHYLAIVRKEFYHAIREPATLVMLTLGPVLLLLVFVYMMTADVKNAPVAVVDLAGTDASKQFVEDIDALEVADVVKRPSSTDGIEDMFDNEEVRAVIVLPEDFGQGMAVQAEIYIDGTEPVSAERVLEAVYALGEEQSPFEMPVKVAVERRYNPDLSNVVAFFPGIAAIVLSLPGIALTLALAREHELGTMEQLIATPVNKLALLLGKITPYLIFGMLDVFLILAVGRVAYDVPFRGNLLEFTFLSFFFVVSNMGVGLLIAVFMRSQQVAMVVAFLVFFVPSFFLSGVFFPISAMPWIVQIELLMVPVTHYVTISKAMYLQGTSIGALWLNMVALAGLSVGLVAMSVALFRKKVA
jgi:ABC-2 type transport system permease protein